MKYVKTYEETTNEPQVGDYVICGDPGKFMKYKSKRDNFNYFLSRNVGNIVHKTSDLYKVMYDAEPTIEVLEYAFYEKNYHQIKNIPNIKIFHDKWTNITGFNLDEILYFAPTKEEVEIKLNRNKYNI